uniref:CSON003237 protein n=1 Tax=Culicoides sonorensis TaxID=179676 RepID=A0A336L278_CULSO
MPGTPGIGEQGPPGTPGFPAKRLNLDEKRKIEVSQEHRENPEKRGKKVFKAYKTVDPKR